MACDVNNVGPGCTSDFGTGTGNYTWVSQGSPASISGSVTCLCAYYGTLAGSTRKFAFFTASDNNLTTVAGSIVDVGNGTGAAGSYSFEAGTDFTAFSVSSGNYIGGYSTAAIRYSLSGGSGLWYKSGDNTNVSATTFSNDVDGRVGLSADIEAGSITHSVTPKKSKQLTHSEEETGYNAISNSSCWGQTTGVQEVNTRTFVQDWIGTGAITGSGDSELVTLDVGEYMDSIMVWTGNRGVTLRSSKYGVGHQANIQYKNGATAELCQAQSWTDYTDMFMSAGYVQIRVNN